MAGFWSKVGTFLGIGKKQKATEPPPPPEAPEKPRQGPQEPPEGPERRGRQYWTETVINRKEELWGDSGRYNPQRAAHNVRSGIVKNHFDPPSLALLQWAARASDDELEMAIRSGDPDYAFLFYK
jgi:hypothetical protein